MVIQASDSNVSQSDSEQVSDLPAGSTSIGSEPAVPSLLDRLRALHKSGLTCKRILRTNPSVNQSHH